MNKISSLFQIKYPIIQAGMIWCSDWKLASAVSNAGGLGLIGAGSMHPEVLEEQITRCRAATDKPFGVNIPLLYPELDVLFDVIIRNKVNIVFTSAGNPAKYTAYLQSQGIKVVHVVANVKSARKCEEAGVDAIVAEGFEAGGHNGKEETTTMVLIPLIREVTQLPLIAAGGISSGKAMLAAMALGAEGVQIGSLFVASKESSAHPHFKNKIIEAGDGETMLTLKKIMPVRLLNNKFYREIQDLESQGADSEQLQQLLGRGRAKKGMFEGDMDEGELEIGQVAALIHEILPAGKIIENIMNEFNASLNALKLLQE
jgi:enoyl-[acyl-carrier protein] reductase II